MASVQTFYLPHFPSNPIYIALFKDVSNASFLRQQLLDANTEFDYAFLDATMILSSTHLLAALFRTLNDSLHNRLKSRTIHSEIVFSLSPNNNIAEAFRRFGISATTNSLIAVKISMSPPSPSNPLSIESVQSHLTRVVQGTQMVFSDETLLGLTDLERLRKVYKLDSGKVGGGGAGKKGRNGKEESVVNGMNGFEDEVDGRLEMESVILGIMALKGS
ncbi:CGI-121-domain-containing protein [Lepidopterella palustris CBS 459.81]|uniref:EKC/KEOPS complex subunit CGI121 n=1 Tax=Lepidopterella palustris CBS 459.81 TaxID=1314670 RepID=A0A8E2EGK3_9PEZI|nr:CGI-121-domain-containing protein [Lepidopterella palustris CBS 459.81]